MQAVEKAPDDRFQSAVEMAAALSALVYGYGVKRRELSAFLMNLKPRE